MLREPHEVEVVIQSVEGERLLLTHGIVFYQTCIVASPTGEQVDCAPRNTRRVLEDMALSESVKEMARQGDIASGMDLQAMLHRRAAVQPVKEARDRTLARLSKQSDKPSSPLVMLITYWSMARL